MWFRALNDDSRYYYFLKVCLADIRTLPFTPFLDVSNRLVFIRFIFGIARPMHKIVYYYETYAIVCIIYIMPIYIRIYKLSKNANRQFPNITEIIIFTDVAINIRSFTLRILQKWKFCFLFSATNSLKFDTRRIKYILIRSLIIPMDKLLVTTTILIYCILIKNAYLLFSLHLQTA